MMELCDKSLNSWTGQCILDCPNIPVQAQGSGRSRRFLTQTIKMARRRTQKETAAEEKEAESSDAKWCNFVMALSCTGGEGSNCDPCLSDCTDSDMNEINAWQDQCEDVADVIDADDDAKESEDIAGSTPQDFAMETLQQYTGGLESAITITGYAMDQLNTLAVRRAFVYAMGQTLQVPEHDIIILTQLQDKVNVMGLGDSKLSSYWDAGSCGMHGNDFQKNWCSAPGSTPAQFNCADSVKVDPGLCPSGHARLAHQYGTGECCLNVAGCDMFYYAQYECTDLGLVSYWDPTKCGIAGANHNWDWCGGTAFECKPTVPVAKTVCPSGTAKLLGTVGTGDPKSPHAMGTGNCSYAYFATYGCVETTVGLPVKGGGEAIPGQVDLVDDNGIEGAIGTEVAGMEQVLPGGKTKVKEGDPLPGVRVEFGVKLRAKPPPSMPNYDAQLVDIRLQSMYLECLFTESGSLECQEGSSRSRNRGLRRLAAEVSPTTTAAKGTKHTEGLIGAGSTAASVTGTGSGGAGSREPLPDDAAGQPQQQGWDLLDIFRQEFSKALKEREHRKLVPDIGAGGAEKPRKVLLSRDGRIMWTAEFGQLGDGVKVGVSGLRVLDMYWVTRTRVVGSCVHVSTGACACGCMGRMGVMCACVYVCTSLVFGSPSPQPTLSHLPTPHITTTSFCLVIYSLSLSLLLSLKPSPRPSSSPSLFSSPLVHTIGIGIARSSAPLDRRPDQSPVRACSL